MLYTILTLTILLGISLYFNYRYVSKNTLLKEEIRAQEHTLQIQYDQIKILSDREPVNAGELLSSGEF